MLMDFSIANKLCEVALYSQSKAPSEEVDKEVKNEFALDIFDLKGGSPTTRSDSLKSVQSMLEFLIFNRDESYDDEVKS